MHQLMDAADI